MPAEESGDDAIPADGAAGDRETHAPNALTVRVRSQMRSMIKLGFLAAVGLLFSAICYGQGMTKAPPQVIELGRSVQGRSINATVFGNGKKRVLVIGGIHGNERSTAAVAKAFANTLEHEPPPNDLTVIVVPEVNPDGLAAGARVNANGVDINRNFPAWSWQPAYRDKSHNSGGQPASEPETRAIVQLLERYPPDLIIGFHAALGCVNWDGPAEELARPIAVASGYPLCPYLGYETPGSLGQYAGRDRNIPAVAVELADADQFETLWTLTLQMVLTRVSSRAVTLSLD